MTYNVNNNQFLFEKISRCKARVRIKADGTKVEIVERHHNHGILTERRKKGVLKALYNEKRKFNLSNFS